MRKSYLSKRNSPMWLLSLTLFLFLASCASTKVSREQGNLLSGTWILDDISYENNTGTFKAVIFNDADAICFEGSNWFFRDNNNTGRYTIANSTLCSGGDRYIRWSIVNGSPNQLQFKFIDEKRNDVSGGVGYRLNIANLAEQNMTLKSNVQVDGEPITIVYEFTKQ